MSSSKSSSSTLALGGLVLATAAGILWWQREQKNKKNSIIYLDYNGTTPIYPDVLKKMMPYLTDHYGNPSSSHGLGRAPREAIDHARRQILQGLLGEEGKSHPIDESSIWFTGCGTESDNLAIALAVQSSPPSNKKKHIVTCNVEHPAIDLYLKQLEEVGKITVSRVPVQPDGRVQAPDVVAALTPDTILVTIMLANNESGAVQPIAEIANTCRQRGILMHTDAAQAAGKISVRLDDLGHPDLVSLVGHKLGAPKGIAALYVRPGCCNEQGRQLHEHGVLLIGGGQEFGRRAGTENTPYIVGFGYAAGEAANHLDENALRMEGLRSRLLSNLQDQLGADRVRVNGPTDPKLRLPNTLSVGLKDIHSGDLLKEVGNQVAASAGATCHSAGGVSSVLKAMKVPSEFARGTLRLSLGPKTTADDVDRAATILAEAAKRQWEQAAKTASQ